MLLGDSGHQCAHFALPGNVVDKGAMLMSVPNYIPSFAVSEQVCCRVESSVQEPAPAVPSGASVTSRD